MSDPGLYTVGWVCAISTEHTAARQFLDSEHDRPDHLSPSDSNDYTLGEIAGHNVVIAVLPDGEYGLSSATGVAVDMINSFPNIRIGLMVGIGGGAPSATRDIRLGDIVVSSPRDSTSGVYQYDFGKTVQGHNFQQTGFLNQPPTLVRTAVSGLRSKFESDGHQIEESINTILEKKPKLRMRYRRPAQESDRLYKSNILHPQEREGSCTELCGKQSIVERPPRSEEDDNPAIHYGIIASANQLMKDAVVRDTLAAEKGILCFEMEAAGLMNRFPCLVIRGICDYSDSHKNKSWQGYAGMTAAAYAKELLKRMVPSRVEGQEKIGKALACISNDINTVQLTTQQTHEALGDFRSQHQSDKIRQWLLPSDPSTNYARALDQRQEGTGLWFLQSETFEGWRKEQDSFLWLYGIPGCGKTILSSAILQTLEQLSNAQPVLMYFFFDFNDTHKQSLDDMARSLVIQLSHHCSGAAQKALDLLFESHDDGAKQPGTEKLMLTLQTMLSHLDEATIVLDALDESKTRKELLTWLYDFLHSKVTKLHVIVTARLEADIDLALRAWTTDEQRIPLQSKVVNEDIRAYINKRVRHDEGLRRWHSRPDIQKEIESQLMEKADGMFRWAKCQLDVLEECLDLRMLRNALSSLPTTPDETYKRILDNIPNVMKPYAVTILQFLAYSPRPLQMPEILDAIAVNPQEKPAFRPENRFPDPRETSKICSSLVTIDTRQNTDPSDVDSMYVGHGSRYSSEDTSYDRESSSHEDSGHRYIDTRVDGDISELQLAHFSVKEYLVSHRVQGVFKGPLEETNSKVSMVETCLSYLCHLDHDLSVRKITENHPFAWYCTAYWATFAAVAEENSESVQRWIEFFFNHEKAYTTSHLIFDFEHGSIWYPAEYEVPLPLYYASASGLKKSVHAMLETNCEVNARSGLHSDALIVASQNGHEEIVQMLLDQGADINAQDYRHYTALIEASQNGHEKIVQMLLDAGADVNTQVYYHDTAITAASRNGYEKIVQMLLDKGADVNAQDDEPCALTEASRRGHEKIVQMLLYKGAEVIAQGGFTTALSMASARGDNNIVRILLDGGADVNAQSRSYLRRDEMSDVDPEHGLCTALVSAARNGHKKIIQLLLDRGANINAQGRDNHHTALAVASRRGHEEIVQILLDRGADLMEKDGRAWGKAIEVAGFSSNYTIERILMEHEVKEDTLSRYLEQFPPPTTPDDPRGQTRLNEEIKCRSIIYTAMRGKEADFAELIDRHRFLSQPDTDPRPPRIHDYDPSSSEFEVDGIDETFEPRKRARRSS